MDSACCKVGTSDNEPQTMLNPIRHKETDSIESHYDHIIHDKMASFITNLKSAQENILVHVDDMKNREVTLPGKHSTVK